jgi:hypothetical protein
MATAQQPKGCFGCLFLVLIGLTLGLGFGVGWDVAGSWLMEYKTFSIGCGILLVGLGIISFGVESNQQEAAGFGTLVSLVGIVVLVVGLVLWGMYPAPVPAPPSINWWALCGGLFLSIVGGASLSMSIQTRDKKNPPGCGGCMTILGLLVTVGAYTGQQAANQGVTAPAPTPSTPAPTVIKPPPATVPTTPPVKPPDPVPVPESPQPTPVASELQWFDNLSGWATVVFFVLWGIFGIGMWTAIEKDTRGPFRFLTEEGRLGACIPILAVVWLLNWLGDDLISLLASGVEAVRQLGDWSIPEVPLIVAPICVVILGALTTPLLASHKWRHPWSREEYDWFDDISAEFSKRAVAQGIIVFVVDVLLLFWLSAAVKTTVAKSWPDDKWSQLPLLLPGADEWVRFGVLLGAFAAVIGVLAAAFFCIEGCLKGFAAKTSYGSAARERSWKLSWRYAYSREVLLYLPTLYIFTVYDKGNPLLLTMVLWFLGVRVVLMILAELLSWILDIVEGS